MTTAVESVRTPPAENKKKKSVTRTYIIFKRFHVELEDPASEDSVEGWREVKRVNSSTERGAIEALGPEAIAAGDAYVAVPERYWRPRNPNVETQTKITF